MVFIARPNAGIARTFAGSKIIKAADYQAWLDAEALIAAARREAEAIIAEAKAAYEAECRRGHEDGLEEARMDSAERMIETVSRTVDYFARVESKMVDLVLESVKKIVTDFDDRDRVTIVVKNALSVVRNQKHMTLRVVPEHVDTLKQRMHELLVDYPGIGYVDIVADGRLSADACILESDIGLVEASMSGQIEALGNAFRRILGSRT
ncbi:HrpE/YscL family type III secretion apparatus protein [Parachitinimonas caeni]|uniref:Type 3 secretion system stator protein n=1 Tax=Parachitinimonas caeni TaxID=3031301 RepID=A0ABT7DTT9_9NEIS|nr:HrpE/YscL family type III secretion apparatus protein [Parachitinimonas caeni]MDK2123496.1 HrpE/YscL family type III secretion apparatus protein [Parachitinimonas caeni]